MYIWYMYIIKCTYIYIYTCIVYNGLQSQDCHLKHSWGNDTKAPARRHSSWGKWPCFSSSQVSQPTFAGEDFGSVPKNLPELSLTVVEPAWNKKNWKHWNVIDILSPFSSCIDILASLVTSLGDPCGGAVVLDVLALEGSSALAQVIGVHDSECETLVPEPWHTQIHA